MLITLIKSILIHEYKHKSTRANTSKHQSIRVNASPTQINMGQHKFDTSQYECDKNQHESPRV